MPCEAKARVPAKEGRGERIASQRHHCHACRLSAPVLGTEASAGMRPGVPLVTAAAEQVARRDCQASCLRWQNVRSWSEMKQIVDHHMAQPCKYSWL